MRRSWCAVGVAVLLAACTSSGSTKHASEPSAPATIKLSSPAFANNGAIPGGYTCDGADASPPLRWSGVPAGSKELAVLVTDPDGNEFVHWVLWGLAPSRTSLIEQQVPFGAHQGRNSFGSTGWRGPCPPRGDTAHHYRFAIYALSKRLNLRDGASADAFRAAIRGHTIAMGTLIGRFGRAA